MLRFSNDPQSENVPDDDDLSEGNGPKTGSFLGEKINDSKVVVHSSSNHTTA